MRRFAPALLTVAALASSGPALAWGNEGHEVVADIARTYLTPIVRAKVDALLASDTDPLTAHDMASEATWADAWRGAGHRETASWHFVDVELDAPDLKSACFGFPAPANPASAGPAQDCVVDKVNEFAAELAAPATAPAERLRALKYLLHFVGDMHQPLHSSDNHDRGGNCVLISLGGSRTQNLHAYWDTNVVSEQGSDPVALATTLRTRITPALAARWRAGVPGDWAREAYGVARAATYRIGSLPGCAGDAAPITLPEGYDPAAQLAAALQLERAGVRLALILHRALANVVVAAATPGETPPVVAASPAAGASGRTAASLDCSAKADRQNLHGAERKRFRRACLRDAATAQGTSP